MIKLSGLNKIKTSVFISGNGSNLKNLFRFLGLLNAVIGKSSWYRPKLY